MHIFALYDAMLYAMIAYTREQLIYCDIFIFLLSGQYKYYTFLEELSCDGCKEDDEVNIINMPLLSLIGSGQ